MVCSQWEAWEMLIGQMNELYGPGLITRTPSWPQTRGPNDYLVGQIVTHAYLPREESVGLLVSPCYLSPLLAVGRPKGDRLKFLGPNWWVGN